MTVPVSGSSTWLSVGHPVGRAHPPRRDVHLPARGAALPDQPALGQAAQVGALRRRRGVLVPQPHRGDRHRDGIGVIRGRPRSGIGVGGGRRVARLEARDVADTAHPLRRPARPDAQARPHRGGRPGVHRVQHRGVGAVEPDQRPAERVVKRLARQRLRLPRPAQHGPGRPDLDQLPRRLGRHRVVLERRRVHPAVRPARAEDAPVPERGHEPAEHRPERPRVVERDLHRRVQLGVRHPLIVERVLVIACPNLERVLDWARDRHRLVDHSGARHPDRVAVIEPDGTVVSYAELAARADQFGRGLQALGLAPRLDRGRDAAERRRSARAVLRRAGDRALRGAR